LESLDQHTDVLIVEEDSEQCIEMLEKEYKALKPYIFYSNNCFVSTGLIEDAGENLLDKEIELMRQMMMKEFRKRPAAVKQRRSSKRKTTEDCESVASGARQHKVWKPRERRRAIAHDDLQHKIWDPGIHRSEHMIRGS